MKIHPFHLDTYLIFILLLRCEILQYCFILNQFHFLTYFTKQKKVNCVSIILIIFMFFYYIVVNYFI